MASTGSPDTAGHLVNVASPQADGSGHVDRDLANNQAWVAFRVGAGVELRALGGFPVAPQPTGSTQALTLGVQNLGPGAAPAGGTIAPPSPPGSRSTACRRAAAGRPLAWCWPCPPC